MLHFYSVIIDQDMSAPGHGKEAIDGINAIDKRYIYQLMSNVQRTGLKKIDMRMHTTTATNSVILSK